MTQIWATQTTRLLENKDESRPLLGNSIGALGTLLVTTIRVIVAADELSGDEKHAEKRVDILIITNALRVAGRTLTAASS